MLVIMLFLYLTTEVEITRFARFLATPFLFSCYLILPQPDLIEYFFARTKYFHSTKVGHLVAFGVGQTSIQIISCGDTGFWFYA